MALIKCEKCGELISDKAKRCPNCEKKAEQFSENPLTTNSNPQSDRDKREWMAGLITIILLVITICVLITRWLN